MTKQVIVIHPRDNVATATAALKKGTALDLSGEAGSQALVLLEDIPFGHKVALREIVKGEQVIKYGEAIGLATAPIKAGQHVHVHNVESQRGRGDKGGAV